MLLQGVHTEHSSSIRRLNIGPSRIFKPGDFESLDAYLAAVLIKATWGELGGHISITWHLVARQGSRIQGGIS